MTRSPKPIPKKDRTSYTRVFTPKGQEHSGFAVVSPSYFRVAEELLSAAAVHGTILNDSRYDHRVPAAICLLHASVECYQNELLGLSMGSSLRSTARTAEARKIQGRPFNERKLNEFCAYYRIKSHMRRQLVSQVIALIDLRDRLYHATLEMKLAGEFPTLIGPALKAAKVKAFNAHWTTHCQDVKLGQWAMATVRAFGTDVHRCLRARYPGRLHLHPPSYFSDVADTQVTRDNSPAGKLRVYESFLTSD